MTKNPNIPNSSTLPLPTVEQTFTAKNPLSNVDVQKALHEYLDAALSASDKLKVSMWLSNVRLLLMFSACAGGLYAQFGCKFQKDNAWIAFFAVMYFVQSGVVQLIDWFVMKKAVGVILVNDRRVFVDAEAPTADNNVTFRLRSEICSVESRKSVGQFFFDDGRLAQAAVWQEISDLHGQYLAQAKLAHTKKD